jgi:GT2 family glycosyltransferase
MRVGIKNAGRIGIVIPVTSTTPMWQLKECVGSIFDAMTPGIRSDNHQPAEPQISVTIVISAGPLWDQVWSFKKGLELPDRDTPPGIEIVVTCGAGGSFAENTNRGVMLALEKKSEWILLLNADTHIAPGQLEAWTTHLTTIDDLAICGCVSNYIGGPAWVELPQGDIFPVAQNHALCVTNWKLHQLDVLSLRDLFYRVAREARTSFDFLLQDAPDIKMVAAAIPRWAFDQIGFLDTRFRPGNREDVDWCWRARQAGFRTAFAHGIFVHHYGSTSFEKNDSWDEAMNKNRARFNAKWSHTTRYQMTLNAHDYIVRPDKLLDVMDREEPYSLDPLLWRARCYGSARPRMVIRDITGYLGLHRNDPEAHWLLAEALFQIGRRADAIGVVTDMINCYPLMREQIQRNLESRITEDEHGNRTPTAPR